MSTTPGRQDASKPERLPHASLDRGTRIPKARKIINMIGMERFRSARRLLEVGCGAGVITNILAQHGGEGLEVHAVDVVDERVEKEDYAFRQVNGTALPYPDGHFDIVISNHVIEHVGDESDQRQHLREIRRVLADGGVAYLAVPNRWRLVEPHFHLPLLSWLPRKMGDRYVRLSGRGERYDCNPPSHAQALALFASAPLAVDDITIGVIRETLAIERGSSAVRMFDRWIPAFVPRLLMPLMPTYVFLLRK